MKDDAFAQMSAHQVAKVKIYDDKCITVAMAAAPKNYTSIIGIKQANAKITGEDLELMMSLN